MRGFSDQLHSVLSVIVDFTEFSRQSSNVLAKFTFEGYKEEDIVISYQDYQEYIQKRIKL